MLRYWTAGESHGKTLLALVDGFPAGVEIDTDLIDVELKRRQGGYGARRSAADRDRQGRRAHRHLARQDDWQSDSARGRQPRLQARTPRRFAPVRGLGMAISPEP